MQTAFQSGAFQVSGFQIVAVTQDAGGGGGYGFGAYDPYRRRRRREDEERDELAREIAALEAHLGVESSIVPRETIEAVDDLPRLRARVREAQVEQLSNRARRAVEHARRARTRESLLLAERALAQAEEQEALAMLIALALD